MRCLEGNGKRSVRIALAVFVSATAGACDLIGPEAIHGPGLLAVELVSPNLSEGAAVFRVTGGGRFGSVMTTGGKTFFRHGEDQSDVVVVLDAPGEIRFEISTDDVAKVPEVSVIQVAGGDDALRGSLADYEIRITKVKQGNGSGGSQ